MEIKLFEKYLIKPEIVFKSERDELVCQIVGYINEERKGTKYKPITKKSISILLNKRYGNDNNQVYQLLSICKDNKVRQQSFSKYFWWKLKTP